MYVLDSLISMSPNTDLSLQERSHSRFYKWNLYLNRFLKLWEQKKKGSTTPCINRKMVPRHQHLCFSGSKPWDLPSGIHLVAWGSRTAGMGRVTEKEEKPVQGCVIKVCYGQRACFYKPQGSIQNASLILRLRTGDQTSAQSCPDFPTIPSPAESKS